MTSFAPALSSPADARTVRRITFPIIGPASVNNDFHAPRVGHLHQGNDVFGRKGQKLVAAVDGVVEWVVRPQSGRSLGFSIRDEDGYSYWYLHVNNDRPGTDDGSSLGAFAYAPDVRGGNPVVAGQLLGWIGDSGNAETTSPHVHFELHEPDGDAIDPNPTLGTARRITAAVVPPPMAGELLPFSQFSGGASVATGQLDRNTPTLERVVATGPGGGPMIRVYGENDRLLSQFRPYPTAFRGGLDVAVGDLTGDGQAEIIVGAGRGGTVRQVKLFSYAGELINEFDAYAASFRGGVRVAAADLDGDGVDEIVTGPNQGGGPHVRVFDRSGHRLAQFFAFAPSFRGGIDVAAYPATAESPAVIAAAAGPGGGPHVRIFSLDGTLRWQFFTDQGRFRGGLRVSLANIETASPAPEIIAVPASRGAADISVFDLSGSLLDQQSFLEPWWTGGYDVAGADGIVTFISGRGELANRRTTLRTWTFTPPPPDPFDFFDDDDESGTFAAAGHGSRSAR